MTKGEFDFNIRGAKEMGNDNPFWSGYQLGMRQLYYGESFLPKAAAEMEVEKSDPEWKKRKAGYDTGLSGKSFIAAMEIYNEPKKLECKRCGFGKNGEWKSRVDDPKKCPKCMNPLWKTARTGNEPGPKPKK